MANTDRRAEGEGLPGLLFRMIPRRGRILGEPSNTFGAGGNFIPERKTDRSALVTSLRGKATDGSDIDIITGSRRRDQFVRFEARPVSAGNVRSELATGPLFDFGEEVRIEFTFRADLKDDITGTAYLLQFWQPVISPIGGIRIQNGEIQAVTRSAGGAWSTPFRENRWVKLVMTFQAGADGHFRVFDRSGRLLGETEGLINGGSQAGQTLDDAWRPKFGFYGSAQNALDVDVRRFVISEA